MCHSFNPLLSLSDVDVKQLLSQVNFQSSSEFKNCFNNATVRKNNFQSSSEFKCIDVVDAVENSITFNPLLSLRTKPLKPVEKKSPIFQSSSEFKKNFICILCHFQLIPFNPLLSLSSTTAICK